jgi:hypothetical protein
MEEQMNTPKRQAWADRPRKKPAAPFANEPNNKKFVALVDESKLSQEKLAEILDCTRQTIWNLRTGKSRVTKPILFYLTMTIGTMEVAK